MSIDLIEQTTLQLLDYIEREDYSGYDPYDALQSTLFNLPFFRSNKPVRFLSQQLVKRSSVNLRPLLRIKKGKNPVTLGLCIQAYAYLIQTFPDRKLEFVLKANALVSQLEKLVPHGFYGACWGYEFDWEARNAKIPKYQPTVVATGIITNGLYEYYQVEKNPVCKELIISSAEFVLKELNRSNEEEKICFSYSPFDHQKVYNASAKGVRLLAQASSLSSKQEFLEIAKNGVEYIIGRQNTDGSWFYADSPKSAWIDSYHTGYILDCLDSYQKLSKDGSYHQNIIKGFDYFKKTFIEPSGLVKTYSDKMYPIDCTSVGQTVLTLLRFNNVETARIVIEKTISDMYDTQNHFFYYRKYSDRINKTAFMRWSQAWMIVAMSYYLTKD